MEEFIDFKEPTKVWAKTNNVFTDNFEGEAIVIGISSNGLRK
jgi:hypothetical protein